MTARIVSLIGAGATRTTPGQEFALGEVARGDKGTEWIYIQAASAIAQYDAVQIDENFSAQPASTTTTDAARGDMIGIAQTAIASGEYGWIARRGTGLKVNAGASCAANTALNSTGTAGQLDDDASVGAEAIDGIVLSAANGGAAGPVDCILNSPDIGATL